MSLIAGRGRRRSPVGATDTSAPPSAVDQYPHDAYRTCRSPEFFSSLLDELFVNIQGRRQYLWRAVDQNGDVIDILSNRGAIAGRPHVSFASC